MSAPPPKIKDAVSYVSDGTWDLPELQRRFVWKNHPDKIRNLVDSILKDYNIGMFLLWSPERSYSFSSDGRRRTWIIDGQQRLVTLCLIFGRKPYWFDNEEWEELLKRYDVMVNLESPLGELEVGMANPARRKSSKWVSIRKILNCENEEELSKLAKRIAKDLERVYNKSFDEIYSNVYSKLKKVWDIREKHLLVDYIPRDKDIEDVVEIFTRINMAGTQLKQADIYIALISSKRPGWVKSEFNKFLRILEKRYGYRLHPGVILRTLTGIGEGKTRFADVSEDFFEDDNKFMKSWEETKESIIFIIDKLKEKGILGSDIIPSLNSLIPLFLLYSKFKNDFNFDRAFHWFILANRSGRYSGAAITILSQDAKTIAESNSFDDTINALESKLDVPTEFRDDDFLVNYKRSRFGRFLLYLLLYDKRARDWLTGKRIGFERNQPVVGYRPEFHHFMPRRLMKNLGYRDDEINVLANIVVITKKTNNRIRMKAPHLYIKELGISKEDLKRFIIPLDERLWRPENYRDFIKTRAQMLASEANNYLRRLVS